MVLCKFEPARTGQNDREKKSAKDMHGGTIAVQCSKKLTQPPSVRNNRLPCTE